MLMPPPHCTPLQVAGGRTMRMRTNDPVYLDHVERWWAVVFSKLRHYLHANGGPILMVQASFALTGGRWQGYACLERAAG